MAKKGYVGIDNVARKVTKQYIGVNNVARKVTKGYVGVDNVARLCFAGDTPVGDLEVGSSVYMTDSDGDLIEFIVVHHGNPDTEIYDSSCDGTWLLSKMNYFSTKWKSTSSIDKKYSASSIHTILNGRVIEDYFAEYAETIKEIKIPYSYATSYATSSGTYYIYYTKENGLTTKLFALSRSEVGGASDSIGSCLEYFSDETTVKEHRRDIEGWWLREMISGGDAYQVNTSGNIDDVFWDTTLGVRPALILPSDVLVDENFNVII